jgi:glutathione S-transferase
VPLKLYFHPLSSYCHKVLIALYEKDIPFEAVFVDFGNAAESEAFSKMWPIRKFPLLRDEARDRLIPESSMVIEYLEEHFPGKTQVIPADREAAFKARQLDRFFDLHVHTHMQKLVGDRLRPEGQHDPFGVQEAKGKLATAYAILEKDLAGKQWGIGDSYTIADCAASPALFYANMNLPLGTDYPNLLGYLERLKHRPSYARVLKEAEPYFHMVPK